MNRLSAGTKASARQPWLAIPLVPYLVVFAAWWALAIFTLSVRVPFEAWRPVLHWFWAEALLVEKVLPLNALWLSRPFWLLVLMASASGAWFSRERLRRRRNGHPWRS